MAAIFKDVPVRRIYLDPENPRHDPISNEPEIIAYLLENEDVRGLARNIVSVGGTSPIELLALVEHPTVRNGFLAAEGNRRVCALKLLADPDKAPNEKDKRYFRQLQKQLESPISTIPARVFPDLASTATWVRYRHEPGLRARDWDARQSTRHALRNEGKTPNAQALALLDYARRKKLLEPDQLDRIGITTLTRYLSNKEMRFALGLVDGKTSAINVPVDEFDQVLVRFLSDALVEEDPPVHSRSNAAERAKYVQRLQASGVTPVTRGLEAYIPEASNAEQSTHPDAPVVAIDKTGQPRRNKKDRDQAKYVVPAGYAAPIDDPVFQRLFLELRSLPAAQFTFAATYLLRAVIEQAVTLFLRKHGIAPPRELHLKLQKVVGKLEAQAYAGPGLPALRKMSSDLDSRYSPDTIGLFIHGGAVPTKTDVIRAWDTFQPVMSELVRQLT